MLMKWSGASECHDIADSHFTEADCRARVWSDGGAQPRRALHRPRWGSLAGLNWISELITINELWFGLSRPGWPPVESPGSRKSENGGQLPKPLLYLLSLLRRVTVLCKPAPLGRKRCSTLKAAETMSFVDF
jgi:hypothetical protein